mgnify:FL=1
MSTNCPGVEKKENNQIDDTTECLYSDAPAEDADYMQEADTDRDIKAPDRKLSELNILAKKNVEQARQAWKNLGKIKI